MVVAVAALDGHVWRDSWLWLMHSILHLCLDPIADGRGQEAERGYGQQGERREKVVPTSACNPTGLPGPHRLCHTSTPSTLPRSALQILLKREDLQPVFSFKLRGAYNKMANVPPEVLAKGVITSSAGNHAQGVALAASRMVRERRKEGRGEGGRAGGDAARHGCAAGRS